MDIAKLFDKSVHVASPPPGCTNVSIGRPIEGPGGRWIPCASALPGGAYLSCVYEVGPGRKQVCAANRPTRCVDEALSVAIDLAVTAAA